MAKKLTKDQILNDIEKNHNWSWIKEVYERNKYSLNKVALFYRGNKITYKEMFSKMFDYAKSLKCMGICENSEIPACVSNCPEFIYLLGAVSIIGAKINLFSPNFDKNYIEEIINGCNCNVLFATDDNYKLIDNVVSKTNCDKKVIFSLSDSLIRPYKGEGIDKKFYDFSNKVLNFKNNDESVISQDEFISLGKEYSGQIFNDKVGLDDEFTITYSSGTTNSTKPKAIIHKNRSYITMGRYHDKDASETRPMKDMTILAGIPVFSNTNLDSNISDSLMQGCTIALEPIYDRDFFPFSLYINEPNFVVATKSFILNLCKKYHDCLKLPYVMALFAVGEPTSEGEEKYINKCLKQMNAGIDILPRPLSPVPLSIAGGDCEHGGFYFNLFKKYTDMSPDYILKNEKSGVKPFSMVDYAILDDNGNISPNYVVGRLVANSPCTMKGYKNNEEAMSKFYIKDINGKVWGDCNVYAYTDFKGRLHIKGRIMKDSNVIPPYIISDIISKDTKNILSCEVVPILEDDGYTYVAHIDFQPGKTRNVPASIISIESRLNSMLPHDIVCRIAYRIRNYENKFEDFPLTACGKRDIQQLENEGISEKCVKAFLDGDIIKLISYQEYKNNNSIKLSLTK